VDHHSGKGESRDDYAWDENNHGKRHLPLGLDGGATGAPAAGVSLAGFSSWCWFDQFFTV
jgi:hypothetical protein